MSSLADLLAETAFPLYGVPRAAWSGPAFVGDVARGATVRLVQLVYVDDAESRGFAVSNAEPAHAASDPLAVHLTPFVARFDPEPLVALARKRARVLFPAADFASRDTTVTIAGERLGAALHTHRTWPLTLMRTAIRRGGTTTDLAVAGWDLDVTPYAAQVERIDPTFARRFDAREGDRYPPSELLGDD